MIKFYVNTTFYKVNSVKYFQIDFDREIQKNDKFGTVRPIRTNDGTCYSLSHRDHRIILLTVASFFFVYPFSALVLSFLNRFLHIKYLKCSKLYSVSGPAKWAVFNQGVLYFKFNSFNAPPFR